MKTKIAIFLLVISSFCVIAQDGMNHNAVTIFAGTPYYAISDTGDTANSTQVTSKIQQERQFNLSQSDTNSLHISDAFSSIIPEKTDTLDLRSPLLADSLVLDTLQADSIVKDTLATDSADSGSKNRNCRR